MTLRLRFRLRVLALVGAAALSFLCLAPARAENTVTLTITAAGTLTAGIIGETVLPLEYSNEIQHESAVLRLVVSDPRGTSAGWSVSIASSDFVYQGDSAVGLDIPNTGFRILAVTAPVAIAGQPVGEGGPYFDPLSDASLDVPRTVIWAAPGAGSGDYEQRITIVIEVPAGSQVGTYVATLIVAFASAP
jgi:hypothetical protein